MAASPSLSAAEKRQTADTLGMFLKAMDMAAQGYGGGQFDCLSCGAVFYWVKAKSNGHLHGRCSNLACKLGFTQ